VTEEGEVKKARVNEGIVSDIKPTSIKQCEIDEERSEASGCAAFFSDVLDRIFLLCDTFNSLTPACKDDLKKFMVENLIRVDIPFKLYNIPLAVEIEKLCNRYYRHFATLRRGNKTWRELQKDKLVRAQVYIVNVCLVMRACHD
jgi:hypothetical protein